VQVRIEQVAPEVTLPLRRRVLRPYLTSDEHSILPGEREPDTVHLAALSGDGELVATAVLMRERFKHRPERDDAWRLRGMATDERLRGQGIGGLLVQRMIEHVAAHGGGLLWCYARVPAQAFYQRAGFVPVGETWEEPRIGPHIAMWREVAQSDVSASPG
jgi:predicted GNAT family N-acyltransferase